MKDNVLVISDLHFPAEHPKALKLCLEVYKEYKCTKVVFIGDLFDNHAVSTHTKNQEYDISPINEFKAQKKCVAKWFKAFPNAYVVYGNHDERIYRLAGQHGIVNNRFVPLEKLYGTPTWKWVSNIVIDNVYYVHGHGTGGGNVCPALSAAKSRMQSVVMGHYHSIAGVLYAAGPTQMIFGMNVGCLVDHKHPAMSYDNKREVKKPIVSCGVVLKGTQAHVIPMKL